jgi:DNA-binding MurR/RpiR family transcriptional regulator
VIDHPADVALLSAREQAQRAGVTPTTMTRLAQRLGIAGYDGVRKIFADAVRRRPDSYRGRAEELPAQRDSEDDAALVQDIFISLAQHLENFSAPESVERFTTAADLVASVGRVYCLGPRSSFAVSYIFHYIRSLFGSNSVLVDGSGGGIGIDVLRGVGRDDVLLVISVKPYVRQTIEAARYVRSRRGRIIAVTDSEISPLIPLADVTLFVRTAGSHLAHIAQCCFSGDGLYAVVRRASWPPAAALVGQKRLKNRLNCCLSNDRRQSAFEPAYLVVEVAEIIIHKADEPTWSEWQDLNLRPPRPERGAISNPLTFRLSATRLPMCDAEHAKRHSHRVPLSAALPMRPDRHQRMVKCRNMFVVCAARRSPTGHRRSKKFGVDTDEHLLVIRQPIVGMDCGYGTHGFAQPAVDALRRVDIHGASSLVDAIDRTDV